MDFQKNGFKGGIWKRNVFRAVGFGGFKGRLWAACGLLVSWLWAARGLLVSWLWAACGLVFG
jgi:hypothetical protein